MKPARGFGHVRTWVFDLDNTLYPHHVNLWQQVDVRIRDYVARFLRLPADEAFIIQKDLYKRYGTTMRGLMTEHGRKHVEAAKKDGRWDKAYGMGKELPIQPDFQAAIDAVPEAKAMLGVLTEQNRFALAFRVHNLKTEAARKKKIEAFVEMLRKGETIYPQKARAPGK